MDLKREIDMYKFEVNYVLGKKQYKTDVDLLANNIYGL